MTTTILGALAIGLTLGLLGSGGSILTVPVLVYLLGHPDKAAIAESLAIVGGISLVAMLPYARARQIDWRSVVLFGLPGMGGTYIGAWIATYVSGPLQLVLFAAVMLAASVMMVRPPKSVRQSDELSADHRGSEPPASHHPVWQIMLEGLAVGILTGLVGVGGGFLIVPALVILGGLPMRLAVGTSLVVIALKSLTGFIKYLAVLSSTQLHVDWRTVLLFVAVGAFGTVAGRMINQRLDQRRLRRVFAVFLVLMALFVLGREVPHLMRHNTASVQGDGEPVTAVDTAHAEFQQAAVRKFREHPVV